MSSLAISRASPTLAITATGSYWPSSDSAISTARPKSVLSFISIANPVVGAAAARCCAVLSLASASRMRVRSCSMSSSSCVLVRFVVRAICLSPCMTIHHSSAPPKQVNISPGPNEKSRQREGWRRGGRRRCLLADLVCPLARLVLGGLDREAHFLGEVSADEAPDAVVLPVRGLGDLGHRRALGAAQEVQDDALFRELARHLGLLHFGGLLASDLLLGLLLRRGLGLLRGFLRALVGLGRAPLLAGSLLRDGLLRRDGRALFRNGGGFGGFCVLHGGVYPFGGCSAHVDSSLRWPRKARPKFNPSEERFDGGWQAFRGAGNVH